MYTNYVPFKSAESLLHLYDAFGVNKKFTVSKFYRKTRMQIHGKVMRTLSDRRLIKQIVRKNKKGVAEYIVLPEATIFIEKYNIRDLFNQTVQ